VNVQKPSFIDIQMDDGAKLLVEEELWKHNTRKNPPKNYDNASRRSIPDYAYGLAKGGALTTPFSSHYMSTIGASFKISTKLDLGNGKFAKAQLWDTAGQERFRTIGRAYYRGADLIILVYDVTCGQSGSATNLMRWMQECQDGGENKVVVVFGNKTDLNDRREVKPTEVQQWAEENGIFWAEVSAKSSEGLAEAFTRMYAEAYLNNWSLGKPFELLKIVIIGDSGVGKTSLFDRLEGFSVDLSLLAKEFPIHSDHPSPSMPVLKKNAESPKDVPTKKKRVQLPDTNVISLNLGHLGGWIGKCELATGDPELCKRCNAALSMNPNIVQIDNERYWQCLFCLENNELHLEEEEFPQTDQIEYLEKATPSLSENATDDAIVVFCIDTSGSMIVTSPISNKDFKDLRKIQHEQPSIGTGDSTSQYLPNEEKGVKYISRLEAVQQAIEVQLIGLQQEHPDRKVALVTFASDVTIYGDGTTHPIVIAGDRLSNPEELENLNQWWGTDIPQPTKEELDEEQKVRLANAKTKQEIMAILNEAPAKKQPAEDKKVDFKLESIVKSRLALSTKLFSLAEEGQTALGPALLISCAIAAQKPGSKIVLCTDGVANVGVGSMENKENIEAAKDFYNAIAKKALSNNTTISLMGFKGSESNIEVLGSMSTHTGGQVDVVEPSTVQKNFQRIFADDTIAMDVKVSFFMGTGIHFSNKYSAKEWEVEQKSKSDKTVSFELLQKSIGSVNSDSNLLLEFDALNVPSSMKEVPFQVQLFYTRIEDGKRLLRVITRHIPISLNDKEIEENADIEIVGLNSIRSVAEIAQAGNYTYSRLRNYANLQFMKKLVAASKDKEEASEVLKNFVLHSVKFEDKIYREQLRELHKGNPWDETEKDEQVSVNEGSGGFFSFFSSPSPSPSSGSGGGFLSSLFSFVTPSNASMRAEEPTTNQQQTRGTRTDDVSNLLWQMKGANMI